MRPPFLIFALVFGLLSFVLCSVAVFGQPWYKISQKDALYFDFKHLEYCTNSGCFKYCDERPSMRENELNVLCDSNGWRKVVFGFTILTFALLILGVVFFFMSSTLNYDARLRFAGYIPFFFAFIFGLVASCVYLGKNGSFKNDYQEYVEHQVTDINIAVDAKYNAYPYILCAASLISLCEFLLSGFAELLEIFGERQSGNANNNKVVPRVPKELVRTAKRPIEMAVDAGVSDSTVDTSTASQTSGYVSESKSAVSSSGSTSSAAASENASGSGSGSKSASGSGSATASKSSASGSKSGSGSGSKSGSKSATTSSSASASSSSNSASSASSSVSN